MDKNLMDLTFFNIRINLILLVNNGGQIVYEKAFDLKTKSELPVPESTDEHIYSGSPILSKTGTDEKMGGIISLREGPMLFSSQPILTSEQKGPSHGTLIMGRFIDPVEIDHLSKMINLTLSVYGTSDDKMPGDFRNAMEHLLSGEAAFVQTIDSDNVAGYRLLNDVYGSPALVLGIRVTRDVYKQGIMGISYFMLSTFVVCVLIGLGTIIIIERSVLKPLSRFCEQVSRIGESGDLSARIVVSGEDELSDAARTANTMLDELEKSQKKLHAERISAIGQAATKTAHDLRNPL
ncbi:MAG: CHASE4 domain-containing protein [Nitrososphaeria archaeon]